MPFSEFIRGILLLLGGYLSVGLVFSGLFHFRGLHAMDPATRSTGIGFRLIITPGLIALWPVVAFRWSRARHTPRRVSEPPDLVSQRRLRQSHALLWQTLAVLLPGIVGAALFLRPTPVLESSLPTALHLPPSQDSGPRPAPPAP